VFLYVEPPRLLDRLGNDVVPPSPGPYSHFSNASAFTTLSTVPFPRTPS